VTKVMIIEDDPMVMEINKRFLSKVDGFELVGTSDNLENVKEKIVKLKPDLILLDVFFPKGRGTDILKWARIQEINIDVILITADKNSETVAEAFRYGVVDYLIKPFKFQRFEEALKNYKDLQEKLKQTKQVNQKIIDELNNIEIKDTLSISEILSDMEKNPTFSKLLSYILENSDKSFTATSIAKDLGVSRITARRYLDYLDKNNVLMLDLEYGSIGRPKNKFRLNPKYIGEYNEN